MATVNYTTSDFAGNYAYTWAEIPNGDDGQPAIHPGTGDRSVQIFGTFGTGGSVTLQGSNNGTNWATMHDTGGTDLTFTAAGLEAVLENTQYIRPIVTAGDGTTAITVILNVRR